MADENTMRIQLQGVASYRELCRNVRRSGRNNVLFAGLMLFLAYSTFQMQAAAAGGRIFALVYIGLALAELATGLYKYLFPSAEGILLDAIFLSLFAAWVLVRQLLVINAGGQPTTWLIILGIFMFYGALGRFREYRALRVLFADRPTAEQIAWFDDLIREIRSADPQTDELALDLPTKPKWKAKLLGSTAFLVGTKTESVLIAGPDDFDLRPAGKRRRDGYLNVILCVHAVDYPEFEIDPASLENYRKWLAAVDRRA